MLIVALVLAVIGLAALVTAVVTSNEIVAWVCIGASALGVVLLVVDAVRERQRRAAAAVGVVGTPDVTTEVDTMAVGGEDATDLVSSAVGPLSEQEYEIEAETRAEMEAETQAESWALTPDAGTTGEAAERDESAELIAEDHPEEMVHDEPEFDTYDDDEPEYPPSAEESALHTVDESELDSSESELDSAESDVTSAASEER